MRPSARWCLGSVLAASLAAAAPVRAADRAPGPVGGGHFRSSEADSLGFDDFRSLPAGDQLDRRDRARTWLRRARDLDRASAAAPTAADRSARRADAVDACATAVGLVPYLPDAWLAYARNLNLMGEYDDAEACLALFDGTLRYERGEHQRRELQGEAHAVRARVAFNRGDAAASEREARAALAIDEGDDETRFVLVRALIAAERFDEAREEIGDFETRGPTYPSVLAALGVLEMRDGRLERAEDAFDRAHEYGMRGPVFDNDRGRMYLERGRYDRAVECFEDALGSVPSFHEARSNLAVAHRRAGRLDEADRVLQELLERRPDYGPAHFNRAEILREKLEASDDSAVRERLGAEAFLHYTAALDAGYDPERVIDRRASLAYRTDDLDRAEADLLRMTSDPSVDGRVLFLLGRVKKQQGRLDIAKSLLEMAAERGYDAPRLHAEMGEVLARSGDLEGARDALVRALSGDATEDLIVTRVNLSVVLAQLGDREGALEALAEAERLDPDHPLVVQQREALATDER